MTGSQVDLALAGVPLGAGGHDRLAPGSEFSARLTDSQGFSGRGPRRAPDRYPERQRRRDPVGHAGAQLMKAPATVTTDCHGCSPAWSSAEPRWRSPRTRASMARSPEVAAHQLIEEVERSGLRGRGGADFPTARKLRAVAERRRVSGGGSSTVPRPSRRARRTGCCWRGSRISCSTARCLRPAPSVRDR